MFVCVTNKPLNFENMKAREKEGKKANEQN